MDASLNIVNLIENNPITKLSDTYNNKLLEKIQHNFTEKQQHLFVSSFYCYLKYNPTNDFVIDLDNVWKWMGFSTKQKAKTLLEQQFIIEKDYKILLSQSREQKNEGIDNNILLIPQVKQTNDSRGGHNKQTIIMNIRTFKLFCIKAGTQKANEIHEYFVKLEDILHQTIQEECQDLRLQLENNKIQSETEKDILREKTLLEQFPVNTQCVYYGYIDNKSDKNEKLIKFGNSNDLCTRVKCHKKKYTNFRLVNAFKVDNKFYVENSIKNNKALIPYRRTIEINNVKCNELLAIDKLSLQDIDNIIKDIIKNLEYNPENYAKLLEENIKLKNEGELLKSENERFHLANNKITREISTQTCEEDFIEAPLNQNENDELTKKFNAYIEEHCIVHPEAEVSSTDLIGQYRIVAQSVSKEVFLRLNSYLSTRFKPIRLKIQNKKQVVHGFSGVKLKEIEYKKQPINSDEQNFVFHSCIFSPSGKVLFSELVEEYKKWKKEIGKEWLPENEDSLKKYVRETGHTYYTTIWANNENGQGFYGLYLKKDADQYKTTSSTGKRVEKRHIKTNELLGKWETIAKAAEHEKMCAAKMSRSIKNKIVFNDDYYYCAI